MSIDNNEFISRINKVLSFYSLSASAFADKVGAQRSSISHLLSGRNKPSLEFVMKVEQSFKEVSISWLLYGEGSFPTKEATQTTMPLAVAPKAKTTPTPIPLESKNKPATKTKSAAKEIDRIIIFYKDGSFSAFQET